MKVAIIGGGIAGSFLAYYFSREQNVEVTLFDEAKNSASDIAAGIVNVITGFNFSLTWNAKLLVNKINELINSDEKIKKTFVNKAIYRPFPDNYMQNKVYEKSLSKDYSSFIEINNKPLDNIINPYGGIWVKNLGYFKVPELLKVLRSSVKYVNAAVPYSAIDVKKIKVFNEKYDKIVFCEGVNIFNNPYIKTDKKIEPLKGETLTLLVPGLKIDYILIKKAYIIPLTENIYKVGSTYERGIIDFSPTEQGKRELLEKFFSVVPEQSYVVLDHKAGVRLTTFDRRFFIGEHPEYKNVYFFNGLGTKGLLQAPYGSELLVNHIIRNEKIPEDVELKRILL